MSATLQTLLSPTPTCQAEPARRQARPRARNATLARVAGAVAGPLFFTAGLIQATARHGFDFRRHTLSLLMNGDHGWIQVINFMATGLLFVVAALGMRAVYRSSLSRTTLLLGIFGLSLVAAGVFRPDPSYGFPPGTAAGAPDSMSWHGVLHLAVAAAGFSALIAACFTAARQFTRCGERRWARRSRLVGAAFLVGFVSVGANTAATNILFVVTAAVAFCWASVVLATRPTATGPAILRR